eukprot:scaffold57606_cov46-Prasinocladus_malaysianus.AAC.1
MSICMVSHQLLLVIFKGCPQPRGRAGDLPRPAGGPRRRGSGPGMACLPPAAMDEAQAGGDQLPVVQPGADLRLGRRNPAGRGRPHSDAEPPSPQ